MTEIYILVHGTEYNNSYCLIRKSSFGFTFFFILCMVLVPVFFNGFLLKQRLLYDNTKTFYMGALRYNLFITSMVCKQQSSPSRHTFPCISSSLLGLVPTQQVLVRAILWCESGKPSLSLSLSLVWREHKLEFNSMEAMFIFPH